MAVRDILKMGDARLLRVAATGEPPKQQEEEPQASGAAELKRRRVAELEAALKKTVCRCPLPPARPPAVAAQPRHVCTTS